MDASFLKQLQAQQAAALSNQQLTKNNAVVVGEDYRFKSLEEFQPTRNRFKGVLKTHHLASFSDYVESFSEDTSQCFIDSDAMSAITIFNFGDLDAPGHCDHTAEFRLKASVEYNAVLDMHGQHHSQKKLAEWLEDWVDQITAQDQDGHPLDMKSAIHAIRRLTIATKTEQSHEQGNFHAKRSAMEDIEAKSKAHPLPAFLYFRCTPYDGFEEQEFTLRLSVITGDSAPKLVNRIIGLDRMKIIIAEEFQAKVQKEINGFVTTYIGSFKP